MIRPPNPALDNANVDALLSQVRELRRTVEELAAAVATGARVRTGSVSATGGTVLTAALDGGGTAQCRFIVGYTPTVGHKGFVLAWPGVNLWLGRDSVP